jgi:hypothetical protein
LVEANDGSKINMTIYKIKLSQYPDIDKTYEYFNSTQGWSNLRNVIYFEKQEDVLKFLYEYTVSNDNDWHGEEQIKVIAQEEIDKIIKNNMLDDVGEKYHDFSFRSTIRISKIRLNNIDNVLNSPIVKNND